MFLRVGLIAICLSLAVLAAAGQSAAPVATQSDSAAPAAEGAFSQDDAEQALSALRRGFAGHNLSRTLALFDRERLPGYDEFASQLTVLFRQYEAFRVRFHIQQTVEESNIAVVEFTLEVTPLGNPAVASSPPPVRQSEQLRFTFGRAGKAWKIVDVQPRGFFGKF